MQPKSPRDTKEKFYSQTIIGKEKWLLRSTAYRVEVVDWLSTFIYKKTYPEGENYQIVEEITGCAIGRGPTEEEAIENTRETLRDKGKREVLRDVVKGGMSEDISPKFRPKMRKAIRG